MLVLSRMEGETIVLDDGLITIHVLGIHGNKVRLGVHAPREISAVRGEAWRKRQREAEGDTEPEQPLGDEW
jgi:carbon storage regulator